MAQQAAERIRSAALHVEAVEQSRTRRSPAPPFTTSTLQQEASRKLGFSVRRTMRIAQALGGVRRGLAVAHHQRLDAVGDLLHRPAQLLDCPIGGVALRNVIGKSVVDQPLGQRRRQHQVALRDGD